jgi:DNA helicase IV
VLVVGPNPTFMEYVSHVLPALGEDAVEQRAIGELVAGIGPSAVDPLDVARLKGDVRLAEVVARAVELRSRAEPAELYARLDGAFVKVREREVRELLEEIRAAYGLTATARERFRMAVLRRFYEDYNRVHADRALRDFGEIEKAVGAGGFLKRWLDAVWPAPKPDDIVRALLTSRDALAEAAEGILDAAEQKLLLRPRKSFAWTDGDVALLDEARALVHKPPHVSGHVIVDEAQDLTPMQLRMVARRAVPGSLTILGDVAQATGAVAYEAWEELLAYLPRGEEAVVAELRHAYRVPREIMELALPLLERIAPGLEPPLAFRSGGEPPRLVRVGDDELVSAALREATALAREEGLLAVILPDELRPEVEAGSVFDDGVALLAPRAAKGLEFDHVVVVEPALIAAHDQGLRELYVALTRPTRTLVVVHSRPLP